MADIFVGLSILITMVKYTGWMDKIFRDVTCAWILNVIMNSDFVAPIITYAHTVAMTIDRYVAVHYPLQYHQIITPFRLKILIFLSWSTGLVFIIMTPLVNGVECNHFYGDIRRNYLTLAFLCAIILSNTVMYIKIWLIAHKQSLQINALEMHKKRPKLDKATKMVFVINAICILAWSPFFLLQFILHYLNYAVGSFPTMLTIAGVIGISNSLVNNVIYFLVNKDFKYAYKKILHCK